MIWAYAHQNEVIARQERREVKLVVGAGRSMSGF
jgi:hypothetical protein